MPQHTGAGEALAGLREEQIRLGEVDVGLGRDDPVQVIGGLLDLLLKTGTPGGVEAIAHAVEHGAYTMVYL
ncbi:MAG: hypothetical protein IIY08_06485 [Cellulosilyticum sp.]|nr:hypothetical protein [Cellulosilyticum sp.]